MFKKALLLIAATTIFSCADKNANLPDGLYANIETNKGTIIAQLEFEKTPVTVANFVTLAEGTNVFVDERFRGNKFYDGLKFHRVIPNFMIQGGDPMGNGSGDAGYKFKDEITDLQHDKAGILSMANSGPGTNSSQFFITHKETSWLDGKHTVFGHVVEGIETVNKIVGDDAILSIKIIRKGTAAKKFDAVKTFSTYFKNAAEEKKQADAEADRLKKEYTEKYRTVIESQLAYFNALKAKATKTATGFQYIITQEGTGKKPVEGTAIQIRYAGFLEDGTLFDTTSEQIATKFGTFDPERARQNAYQPLPYVAGTKTGLFPGFIEGMDKLSYGDKAVFFIPAPLALGAAGSGNGVIPPNANLIFEVELVNQ